MRRLWLSMESVSMSSRAIVRRLRKLEEQLDRCDTERSRGEEILELLRQLNDVLGGRRVPRDVIKSVIKELDL